MTLKLKTTDKYKIIDLKMLIVYIETTNFTFIAKYACKFCQGMSFTVLCGSVVFQEFRC